MATDKQYDTPLENVTDGEAAQPRPRHRPLKYETVEQLDRAINAYFDMCDPHTQRRVVDCGINEKGETIWREREVMTEQKPYTISGLANALGVSRQTLLNYAERPDFFDSIDRAKSRCEEYAESQLFGPAANGAKFNLMNNYRGKYQAWADKQELGGPDGAPLMPVGLDAAILQRMTHGKTPPGTAEDSSKPDTV
jgi:hypothetical protein